MIFRAFIQTSISALCVLFAPSPEALALTDAARALLGSNPSFLPSIYSAPAVEAWIVDADTKQPIEGVVVAASWQSELHTYGGRSQGELIRSLEAVTDHKGHFSIPSWGPVLVKQGHVEEESPKLIVFKPGYEFQRLFNESAQSPDKSLPRWHGTRIALKRIGNLSIDQFQLLNNSLIYLLDDPQECRWRTAPRMLEAIRVARVALAGKGLKLRSESATLDEQLVGNARFFEEKGGSKCGNPKNLFGVGPK